MRREAVCRTVVAYHKAERAALRVAVPPLVRGGVARRGAVVDELRARLRRIGRDGQDRAPGGLVATPRWLRHFLGGKRRERLVQACHGVVSVMPSMLARRPAASACERPNR